jgi:hypothetical protein
MKTVNKNCVICTKEKSSYKCPRCSSFYCSVACCTTHKEICGKDVLPIVSDKLEILPNLSLTSLSPLLPPSSTLSNDDKDNSDLLLGNDRINILLTSKWLQDTLKSKRLRDDILSVDSSINRQESLQKLRKINPHFEEFVDLLLKEINNGTISTKQPSNNDNKKASLDKIIEELKEIENTNDDDDENNNEDNDDEDNDVDEHSNNNDIDDENENSSNEISSLLNIS